MTSASKWASIPLTNETSATEELRRLLDERGVEWSDYSDDRVFHTSWNNMSCWFNEFPDGWTAWGMSMHGTPEQAIAATLGSDRLAFLEEKVKLQGDYIDKLTKEKNALFAQGCEAATRHAGQIDAMQRKLEAATLGAECHDVCSSVAEFTCSTCGFNCDLTSWISLFDGDVGRHRHHHHGTPNYCPNCGAKVVDE